jgi:hypothetical protein
VVGDSSANLQIVPGAQGDFVAQGHFVMTAAVGGDPSSGVSARHAISAGPYVAQLQWNGTGFTVNSVASSPTGPPLQRPDAATDDVIRAAAKAGLDGCAAAKVLVPPDCPQSYTWFGPVTNVKWSYVGDEFLGAQISFDPITGTFTVSNFAQMLLTFNDSSGHQQQNVNIRYTAHIVWDGQKASSIYIE